MLTRIEVDGFKNLLGFSAEFGPFTCVVGPNAVGKSNLFDAIEFLSLLAEHPLEEAAEKLRETDGSVESARRLFWTDGERRADTISIAVEMIVPTAAFDELGIPAFPEDVCLRYELGLRFDGRLRLVAERLQSLGGSLESHLRFPHAPGFATIYGNKPGTSPAAHVVFDIGRGQLPGRQRLDFDPSKARRTVLSQYTTADHPTLLAAHLELASWRKLALDPAALRRPDKLGTHEAFSTRGDHLPGQIRRLTESRHPRDITAFEEEEVSARLAAELGTIAGFRKLWVHDDHDTGLMTLKAQLRNGEEVTARQLSDGTLRVLALAILEMTPHPGLFCIEEPENGLHPRRLEDLFALLKRLATDPFDEYFIDESGDPEDEPPPLRQVIVNTHSSELVRAVFRHAREDLLLATTAFISRPDGSTARALRLNPIRETWRCHDGVRGVMLPIVDYVGSAAIRTRHASAAEDG